MIEVSLIGGRHRALWVNPAHIRSISEDDWDGKPCTCLALGGGICYYITEQVSDVLRLMQEAAE